MSVLRAVRLISARPWRCFHYSTRLRTSISLCWQNKNATYCGDIYLPH